MKIKKNSILFALALCVLLTLCGCGVSNADRKKLYNAVLTTGDLQLNKKESEYEKKLVVSNAPVPGGTTYYLYRGINGEKYRFNYKKLVSEGHSYRVIVNAEYQNMSNMENGEGDIIPPEKTITYEYTFVKSIILKRMKLLTSCISGFELRFDKNKILLKGGISDFSIYNNQVRISFDKKIADESISKNIEDYNTGVISDIDIIVRTDCGEYKAEKISYAKDNGRDSYVIAAGINIEGIPESVSVGDTSIDL